MTSLIIGDDMPRGTVTVDDAALFTARFASGAIGSFEASRFALRRKNALRIEVNGTTGSLAFDFEDNNIPQFFDGTEPAREQGFRRIVATEADHPYVVAWWPPGHGLGYEHGFTHQVVDLVEAIAHNDQPTPSFADALQVQRVLAAVEDSAHQQSVWTASPTEGVPMTDRGSAQAGPVRLTANSRVAFRPATRGSISAGLWAGRRRVNREVSVPEGWEHLHTAGNFHDLELAAGLRTGDYINDLPFMDSDVYKWLEALGWALADSELGQAAVAQLHEFLDHSHALLSKVQEDDGYLDSHFQVRFPGERFQQLPWGHELYCLGHLIQAAVALHRTASDARLLDLARRAADLVARSFGIEDGRIDGVCGHPEIETALVELFRETGEPTYLATAQYFIDRRGHGLLGPDRFGAHYWQDHLPIREAPSAEGHSVRQLYLLAGVADVYAETGDDSLRQAAERLWSEMVATKTYLTGGVGAHHTDEAFGDPYELPNERSYCETCAAIASVMFSWRMLMITGEARYADLIERTLYNGFLGGLSLDGSKFIYANPLQVREGHVAGGNDGDYERKSWFRCACCPPNVMRTLASLEHYVVLSSDAEIRVHQYVPGTYAALVADGEATLSVTTDYPWDGQVHIRIDSGPADEWGLGLRVPHWADGVAALVNGDPVTAVPQDGWLVVNRRWAAGDEFVLDLPLAVRFTYADARVDADRGSVALERGPLVYCLEAVDNPGLRLDEIVVDTDSAPVVERQENLLGGVTTIQIQGRQRSTPNPTWWPYGSKTAVGLAPSGSSAIALSAIPYFSWGNRATGAMRVWIPSG